jgi:hypothetical protein
MPIEECGNMLILVAAYLRASGDTAFAVDYRDTLLDLHLFPAEVARKEVAHYLTQQKRYGLPLDSRCDYTKLDWTVWSATLADTEADFRAFIGRLQRWANESPTRVPLTDWYWTTHGRTAGFQARSVVGGLFIKLLKHRKFPAAVTTPVHKPSVLGQEAGTRTAALGEA